MEEVGATRGGFGALVGSWNYKLASITTVGAGCSGSGPSDFGASPRPLCLAVTEEPPTSRQASEEDPVT